MGDITTYAELTLALATREVALDNARAAYLADRNADTRAALDAAQVDLSTFRSYWRGIREALTEG